MTKRDEETPPASTAVATRENGAGALAIPGDNVPGLTGTFGQQDITIPICSLTQPMSQQKGVEGRYSFPDGRSLEGMEVVALGLMATRTCFADMDEGIGEPLCKSADRKFGLTAYPDRIIRGEQQTKPSAERVEVACATCRLGPTAVTFAKSEDNLWCPWTYTVLLADFQTAEPFIFYVKGMAFKEVQRKIISPALMRYKRTGRADPWATTYQWGIRLVEQAAAPGSPAQKYYVPLITPGRELEAEHAQFYADMSAELTVRAKKQETEDTAPPPEQMDLNA